VAFQRAFGIVRADFPLQCVITSASCALSFALNPVCHSPPFSPPLNQLQTFVRIQPMWISLNIEEWLAVFPSVVGGGNKAAEPN